ncbi:MAG: hypothetical protein ABSH09_09945 [Bryobacteraceae bacterium]|jgi:hypothetical protein
MTQDKRSAILIRTGAVLSSFLFLAAIGNASIIPELSGAPSGPSGGPYTYNYTANLQQDESLNPVATDGVTCPGLGGLVQCNPPGTFFTLYDINGYVSGSAAAPSGWYASAQDVGVTPSTVIGSSFDNAALINVTFFYTGPIVSGNGSVLAITGFSFLDAYSGTMLGNYTSQATKNGGIDAGTTDQTVGYVDVPNPGSGITGSTVPEPASASLFAGSGLLLFGLSRFLRRKS